MAIKLAKSFDGKNRKKTGLSEIIIYPQTICSLSIQTFF